MERILFELYQWILVTILSFRKIIPYFKGMFVCLFLWQFNGSVFNKIKLIRINVQFGDRISIKTLVIMYRANKIRTKNIIWDGGGFKNLYYSTYVQSSIKMISL